MCKAVDLFGMIGNDRVVVAVVWSGRQGRAEKSNPPGAARWCGRITEKAHVESGKQDHTNNHNKPQMLLFERMVFVVFFILVTPRSLSLSFSLFLSLCFRLMNHNTKDRRILYLVQSSKFATRRKKGDRKDTMQRPTDVYPRLMESRIRGEPRPRPKTTE